MLFNVLLLVSALWTLGQGILPDLNVTECKITCLKLTLWQTTSRTTAEAACISDNGTCVTGNRYIPFDGDFDEAVGQAISISLTKTVDQCQGMAFTPLDNGVCTILFVSTKYIDGMKFSRQHVCTLPTSEATSSQVSVSFDVSSSIMVPVGADHELPPTISSTAIIVTVSVAAGLLLLLCVTLGMLLLIILLNISCRHTRTRMRHTLSIENPVPNVGPNVLSGSLKDIISCGSVTMYDWIEEGDMESLNGSTPEKKYVNLKKCGEVDNCSCPTDCDQDCTPPVKGLVGYITMESPIPNQKL